MRLSSFALNRWIRYTFLAVCTLLLCLVPVSGLTIPAPPSIPEATPPSNPAQHFDRQGRLFYQTGQWQDAANQFQQAIEAYRVQGDWLRQALSLGNLALAYQQFGQWQQANQTIAEGVHLLESTSVATGQSVDHETDHETNDPENNRVQALAQVLDIQGNLQLAQGQPDAAITSWQRSLQLYQELSPSDSIAGRITENQINQAQALQNLGLYRRAIDLLYQVAGLEQVATQTGNEILQNLSLEELQTQLQTLPHLSTTAIALQRLGEALRITGNLDQAQVVLQNALSLVEQLGQTDLIATIKIQLANLKYAQAVAELSRNNLTLTEAIEFVQQFQQGGDRFGATDLAVQFYQQTEAILDQYQQAVETATTAQIQSRARLNQFNVLVETRRQTEAQALIPLIQQQFQVLPVTHSLLYAQINFANGLMRLQEHQESNEANETNETIERLLLNVIENAKHLKDQRAESYATGSLAKQYEHHKQYDKAEVLTRQALLIAQSIQSSDIAYVWQWQLGRLLKIKGEYTGAIAAYQEAVSTLNTIRQDLIAVSPETQYSFRDTIEPIHRELVALLLSNPTSIAATDLEAVRNVIESLQLSELVNFFREDCLNTEPILIDQVDAQAVVFYPIILPDQLAVIVSLPNKVPQNIPVNLNSSSVLLHCDAISTSSQALSRSLCYYSTAISGLEIEETVNRLRNALEQPNDPDFLSPAQTIYNWLIRPIEPALAQLQNTNPQSDGIPTTLVFVLDGVLRNIPVSVLHDGKQFLVARYNVALTPGLQLLEPRPFQQERLRALIGGLQQARQGFSELSYVIPEINQIETILADRQVLLDQEFTESEFEAAIRSVPFPVVHLATHGQFSSQLDKTFILTWDDRLTINQLRSLLQTTELRQNRPLELLVLSACETAAGDDRATLGLAGMAVRSGARSTMATLWQVSDASSAALMGHFYEELANQDNTKAEALRQAQLSLLNSPNYQHPYYWAPYVLVGNWQ